jgi:hypothetical protein
MTFLALIFAVMALAVFGLQALYFLKEGGLLSVSVIDGLKALDVPWASDPHILAPMHQLLKSVPLALALLFFAAICYFVKQRLRKK